MRALWVRSGNDQRRMGTSVPFLRTCVDLDHLTGSHPVNCEGVQVGDFDCGPTPWWPLSADLAVAAGFRAPRIGPAGQATDLSLAAEAGHSQHVD
jgi:hypothetical protein